MQFIEDAAAVGVKAISLISDGESSLVDYYAESIERMDEAVSGWKTSLTRADRTRMTSP